MTGSGYLEASDPSRWVLDRRGPRNRLDPRRAYEAIWEEEPSPAGVVSVAAVFLTNRECPWRCLMCDLWRNTLEEPVTAGDIPHQIRTALVSLPPARRLKLYNAGSFFDPRAVPHTDYPEAARCCAGFERVIVESHPCLVGARTRELRDLLRDQPGRPVLEVAMGLETVHPEVLPRLNKGMTLDDFRRAAERLAGWQIPLRAFVLVRPPWLTEAEGVEWAVRSAEFAFDCGAETVALIPTRAGNGALEALAAAGEFAEPSLACLEEALERCLGLRRGIVVADLWDLERFGDCAECFPARRGRLARINLTQVAEPLPACASCGSARPA